MTDAIAEEEGSGVVLIGKRESDKCQILVIFGIKLLALTL